MTTIIFIILVAITSLVLTNWNLPLLCRPSRPVVFGWDGVVRYAWIILRWNESGAVIAFNERPLLSLRQWASSPPPLNGWSSKAFRPVWNTALISFHSFAPSASPLQKKDNAGRPGARKDVGEVGLPGILSASAIRRQLEAEQTKMRWSARCEGSFRHRSSVTQQSQTTWDTRGITNCYYINSI